jgi:ubiquinone/menaquinone biosynthesis C-methylase UbiE
MMVPWVADLIALVQPRAQHRVLDLACGTGAVAGRAPGHVVGLDRNRQMLQVAQREADARIHWTQGDAVCLPFLASSFDRVLCQQGLQFFPQRAAALAEIRRVLVPGGLVGVLVWSSIEENPYCLALARAVGRHVDDEVGQQLRESFSLGDGLELEASLREAGFEEVQVRPLHKSLRLAPLAEFVPRHLAGTSLRDVFASQTEETLAAVVADVVQETKPLLAGDDVAFPFEVQTAVGRRR